METSGQKYTYDDWKSEWKIDKYDIILPEKPGKQSVWNWRITKKNQKFTPPKKSMVKEVSRKYDNGEKMSEKELSFLKEEWKRREEGHWFYNNGNLEYITGLHYFYLTAWQFPVVKMMPRDGVMVPVRQSGLPDFTDSDRDYFYVWRHTVTDKNCYGMVHVTNRRDGKTERANCTNYEILSKTKDSMSAIQSKTNADAEEVFKKLVGSWQKMPSYYKPVDTGETRPSKTLRFDEPAKRTSKTQKKEYSQTLRSEITYFNAKEEALDGLGLIFLCQDECGKTKPKEADVAVRWRISRECLAVGSHITGKGLLTTTVEEMEKNGGKQLKEVWDDSNPLERNALGETNSGLYRYFKPAYYGLRGEDEEGNPFIDEYGYSDIKKTKDWLNKKKANLKGRALSDFCRKYPFNEDEAFYIDSKHDAFPTWKIYEQKEYNKYIAKEFLRVGNFHWIDPTTKEAVRFVDNEKGRWIVSWMPEVSERNGRQRTRKGPSPVSKYRGGIGVDPFDHSKTSGKKQSDAGMHGFLGFDPTSPLSSNRFVFEYICRPKSSYELYDDILKVSTFYGWEALIENQKIGSIEWLNDNGFGGYVCRLDKRDYTQSTTRNVMDGISTSGKMVREALIGNLYNYIHDYVGLIEPSIQEGMGLNKIIPDLHGMMPFERTLKDWLDFDPENWTDYDGSVSSMIAYTQVYGFRDRPGRVARKDDSDPDSGITLFKTF